MCYQSFGGVKDPISFLEKFYLIFTYLEVDPIDSRDLRGIIDVFQKPRR